jgi:hypothetical protein
LIGAQTPSMWRKHVAYPIINSWYIDLREAAANVLEIPAKPNRRVTPEPQLSNDLVPGVKNFTDLYRIKATLCIPRKRFFLEQCAWIKKRKIQLCKLTYGWSRTPKYGAFSQAADQARHPCHSNSSLSEPDETRGRCRPLYRIARPHDRWLSMSGMGRMLPQCNQTAANDEAEWMVPILPR